MVTQKKISELDNDSIDALASLGLGYVVFNNLPDSIKQGLIVLHNNQLWRGLLNGESSLPAGTPWPIKGFYEYLVVCSFEILSGDVVINFTSKNDFSQDITWNVVSPGSFVFSLPPLFENCPITLNDVPHACNFVVSVGDETLVYLKLASESVFQSEVNVNLFDSNFSQSSEALFNVMMHFKFYPPPTV